MKDIDEIRRANLRLLEKESGGLASVAKVIEMSPAQFANLRDGAKDSKTGVPRGMRKATARRIEAAFQKPQGWLDIDHDTAEGTANRSPHPVAWLDEAPHSLSFLARSLILEIVKVDEAGLSSEGANALLAIIKRILADGPAKPQKRPLADIHSPDQEEG